MSDVDAPVTPEALGKCRMQGQMFLDCEDSYTNVYQCLEHPALTKTASGPAGLAARDKSAKHTVTWRVDGHEVPFDKQVICDALNAHYAARAAKKEAE
jgi:hypothetical protein